LINVVHNFKMKIKSPAWYCARTKPKHEHIAAANLRKNLNLEVFHPRLRIERATRRGVVRVSEPLFPCYIFFRCLIDEKLGEIQRTSGVSTVVHFAHKIPKIADTVIEELKECFEGEETMTVEDRLSPGDEVIVAEGAFSGMRAFVLRVMPARRRVQVLLDVLGRPTPAELDENSVVVEGNGVANLVPMLAAPVAKKSVAVG
jgi:transcriptional antiterminator RfaH